MKKRAWDPAVGFCLIFAVILAFAPAACTPGKKAALKRRYNGPYQGAYLNRVAFPIGGIGAGIFCLEGTGAISHVSVRNVLKFFNFGTVDLEDPAIPLKVSLTGWSPFIPGDADDSSLPVGGFEYSFRNNGRSAVEAVFSFNAKNFMATGSKRDGIGPIKGGFVLFEKGTEEKPADRGALAVFVDDPAAVHKYNLKRDLSDFANPQRPAFAAGKEGGLLLCTWPRGGELALPFVDMKSGALDVKGVYVSGVKKDL